MEGGAVPEERGWKKMLLVENFCPRSGFAHFCANLQTFGDASRIWTYSGRILLFLSSSFFLSNDISITIEQID